MTVLPLCLATRQDSSFVLFVHTRSTRSFIAKAMKVLVASYNMGGVKALEPVVNLLLDRGHDVDYFCSGDRNLENAAPRYLLQRGYPFKFLQDGEMHADLVLVGTSASKTSIDKRLTRMARDKGLPVVAVCDFWGSMDLRFGTEGEFFPTHVTVVDEAAKKQLETFAALHDRHVKVSITGSPSWDCLKTIGQYYRQENIRAQIRERLKRFGVRYANPLVVFASQPIAVRYGSGYHGYTESDVLETLMEILPEGVELTVKLHPSEGAEDIKKIVKNQCPVFMDEEGVSLYEFLAASDIAISMFSTIIIEAIGMGRQALAIEMGSNGSKIWPDYMSESGRLITSKEAIAPTIMRLLDSNPNDGSLQALTKRMNMDGRATERVVDFILQIC